MHPDEANQAWKTGILRQTGQYRYDPAEHHGPTLYYLTLPVLWLAGAGDFAQTTETHYRLLSALAGLGLIGAIGLLHKALGAGPVLAAAALTALSPVMVFYSRYYIQEMLLVLFTLGVLGSLARCRQSQSLAGAVFWAAVAGVLVGLMAATKETWILALGAMGAAGLLCTLGNCWVVQPSKSPLAMPNRSGWPTWPILAVVGLCGAAVTAGVFYTSFGSHPQGILDALEAYRVYLQRGVEAGPHRHPPLFYLERLLAYRAKGVFWTEGFILLLAVVGGGWAFWPRHRPHCLEHPEVEPADIGLIRFLTFYTVVLTILYSAVPYKTPWCAAQFWYGWILLAGVGSWRLMIWPSGLANRLVAWLLWAATGLMLLVGVGHLAWQSWQLNFNPRFYADGERNPWVYAHTAPHLLRLAERMEQLAAATPEGHRMSVHVIVPDNYWPLPWYLRRFDQERVGYWNTVAGWADLPARLPPPHVLIVQAELADQVAPHLPAEYNSQMLFRLRPEVFLRVYVRQDLWEAFLQSVSENPRSQGVNR